METVNFVPEVFGRLTTLDAGFMVPYGTKGKRRKCHMCRCECGTVKQIQHNNLANGHTQSCGCLKFERIVAAKTTHGHCKGGRLSLEWVAYQSMMARCYNPKHPQYKDYGGRGIGVWDTWRGPGGFERWLAHIGLKPDPKMTQDRKHNNGNYEPGNVRWATDEEQRNNTRVSVFITYCGVTKTLTQWSRVSGLAQSTLSRRLRTGWSVEDALTKPPRKITKKAVPA